MLMDKPFNRFVFFSCLCFLFLLVGCGKKGPLQAPLVHLPQAVKQIKAFQRGAALYLEWDFKPVYTDGTSLEFPLTLEVWLAKQGGESENQSLSADLSQEDFEKAAEIVARLVIQEPTESIKGQWKLDLTHPESFRQKYVLALRLLDKRQRKSLFSPLVILTPQNLPQPPGDLQAEVKEKAIVLKWSKPTGFLLKTAGTPLKLKGYHVYRREPEGQWLRLTKKPLGQRTYEDKNFKFGQIYFYKVRAVVNDQEPYIETDDSREIKVEPKDVFPPPPPSGLVAIGSQQGIALSWEPSPAKDVAGYKIWRRREDEKVFQLLTPRPLSELSFIDTQVVAGYFYEYYLTAVDQAGNESQKSPIVREKKGEEDENLSFSLSKENSIWGTGRRSTKTHSGFGFPAFSSGQGDHTPGRSEDTASG